MELLISQRETVNVKWSDICEVYNVPKKLRNHQADAISLISAREHTFCGLPTGSGKTLAEVATVLFTKGTALVIPPLLTIEKQMCDVCDDWQISYLNLSTLSPQDILSAIESISPQIIIASIEKISDLNVQKALLNVHLDYVAIDEAQVGLINIKKCPKITP